MIYFTHDIDWLSPSHPYSIIKAVTHADKWIGLKQISNKNLFLREIEVLLSTDIKHQINPVWLIGAPKSGSFTRYGLRYHIGDTNYMKCLSLLLEAGVETGLHSINSGSFTEQVTTLSSLLQKPVRYHRSHFLKFSTNELTENLIKHQVKVDFSFGHARSITLPELPVSADQGIRFIPTVLFDNIFFFEQPADIFSMLKKVLAQSAKLKQDISILFHPENFVLKPALHQHYAEVIRICKNEGDIFNPRVEA